jgi:hypothetical protein
VSADETAPNLIAGIPNLVEELLDAVLSRFVRSDEPYREEKHGSSTTNGDVVGIDDDRQPSRVGGCEGDRIRSDRPQLTADLYQSCIFAGRRPELDLRWQLPRHQIRNDVPWNLSRRKAALHVGIFPDMVGVGKLNFELGVRN